MALARRSAFQKTYLQLNLIIEDQNDARALQNILFCIENIVYVLSIFSLMILWGFEFLDQSFKKLLMLNDSFTAAWELGYFKVYLITLVIRLLGGEAWQQFQSMYGFR